MGVVGEFYVRLHDGANQDILRKLEAEGAETWLAPATEFFSYANYIGKLLSADRLRDEGFNMGEMKEFAARWVNSKLAAKDEHALCQAALPFLEGYDDIGPRRSSPTARSTWTTTSAARLSAAWARAKTSPVRGIAGIVSVIPFNCMPGNTVTALSQALRRRHGNIPFLNLDYDGFVDSSRDAKIVSFMWQVKERYRGQTQALREECESMELSGKH